MNCRFCKTPLSDVFIDLLNSPASNSFLKEEQLNETESYFPLKVLVCPSCFLVQVDEYKNAHEIFNHDYAYFSSYSKSWLAHAEAYTNMMIERFGFNESHHVFEIASNDGYLLQYFHQQGIPVLGIEPTQNTAEVAQAKGVETLVRYFGTSLAEELVKEGKKANLLLGNNVLAHVPDINDFVGGMKVVLAEQGVITMEFPHLYQLVKGKQFDTIYHEHFSYLSFTTVKQIFEAHGLVMFDVEELTTHGGSIRIFAKHADDISHEITPNVAEMLEKEEKANMKELSYYTDFQGVAKEIKWQLLSFLLEQKKLGKTVVGYGAAAKGNTLLNYCGIKNDLISYVVDASPHKQDKYMPGSHIPVVHEDVLKEGKPDYVIILPWNLKEEITQQLDYIREWGGKFVVAIPSLEVL